MYWAGSGAGCNTSLEQKPESVFHYSIKIMRQNQVEVATCYPTSLLLEMGGISSS